MGEEAKYLTILVWLPQTLGQILNLTYWLQVKEYRFDRFFVFLGTQDGRSKLGLGVVFFKFFVVFLAILRKEFILALFILFLSLDIDFLRQLIGKNLKKPVATERIRNILLTSLIGICLVFVFCFLTRNIFYGILLGEVLSIASPFFGTLWTIPIVNKVKRKDIEKAKILLSEVKPTVIGVTGSYGKTTTKDFIAQILSRKYLTAKTEGSENTEFGIARKAVKNLRPGTKFFVVEMGAYKRGEIRRLCEIVNPTIGVITGIDPQHIALFGSLENIKKAKFELIQSLPEGGIALFNFSNQHCRELFLWAKNLNRNLRLYSYLLKTDKRYYPRASIVSEVISSTVEGVEFKVRLGKEDKIFFAPVTGVHFIENLTCALLISRLMGVSWKQIRQALGDITLPSFTMQKFRFDKNTVVIDDTYNSTPRGFAASLKYLSLFSGNKVIITGGIIELGDLSDKIHLNLAKAIKRLNAKVFLLNKGPFDVMKQILNDSVLFLDAEKLLEELKRPRKEKTTILLEGRLPQKILNYFRGERC